MKYMLLIYGNEATWAALSPEQAEAVFRETDALNRELLESGELIGAYGLDDDDGEAKVVWARAGMPAVTDGPYLESKEHLASFTILECDTLERAMEIAARNPASRHVGVEIRALTHEAPLER